MQARGASIADEGRVPGKSFSYLRVSTDPQGEDDYGLEAQRKAVLDFLDGGEWQLLGEFIEVESVGAMIAQGWPRRSRPARSTR